MEVQQNSREFQKQFILPTTGIFSIESLELESGEILQEVSIKYCTYGSLNLEKNNAIMVCHSLAMSADVGSWWGKLLGPGRAFDTNKYFIVGANVIGSCYGSTGPTTLNHKTGKPYGPTFPTVTIRDTVRAQILLFKEKLGILGVYCVIGGSLGGMQALEWTLLGGTYVKRGIFMCVGAEISPWQMGLNNLQRRAIQQDPAFQGGHYDLEHLPVLQGLSLARLIGLMSYRSHGAYARKFEEVDKKEDAAGGNSMVKVASYLEHHGTKFIYSFDANSYMTLLKMLESHNVGRDRGGIKIALENMTQETLIIGISSDILYPVGEQEILDKLIPNSTLEIIDSKEGHDGFLIEVEAVNTLVSEFLNRPPSASSSIFDL